jgi:hypothetical protein
MNCGRRFGVKKKQNLKGEKSNENDTTEKTVVAHALLGANCGYGTYGNGL